MKVNLTKSEKRVLQRVRSYVGTDTRQYDFWFNYDTKGEAITWEGGFELGQYGRFRNQYTIEKGKQIKKNWEE